MALIVNIFVILRCLFIHKVRTAGKDERLENRSPQSRQHARLQGRLNYISHFEGIASTYIPVCVYFN